MSAPNDRCDVCGELIVPAGDGWDHVDPADVAANDPKPDHPVSRASDATCAEIDGHVAQGFRQERPR